MSAPRRRITRPPRGGERTRRDPRAERDGGDVERGDARPKDAAGATPRARRDPRAAHRAAAAAGERVRIDRTRPFHVVADAPGAAPATDERAKVVCIADPACWVLAVPDHEHGRLSDHDRDVLGAARRLADAQGGAVVVVATADDDALGAAGADRVMPVGAAAVESYAPEARAAAIITAAEALDARHVVLPERPRGWGADIGRRVAAALGELPATRVVRVDGDTITSRGDGGRTDFTRKPPRVVLVEPEAAEPVTGAVHEALPVAAPDACAQRARIVDLGLQPVEPAAVPLAEAELILAGGAGVEDWPAFHALAAALGAAEGGSRVVCDAGALARARQVGASGTIVSARGYIALGISGAPQHLDGIKACECVIAVNTDAHAEIVKRADLAVVGDAQQIMRALLELLGSEAADCA